MKYTVMQYVVVANLPNDMSFLISLSQRASQLSRAQDIPIDRIKDQRFGMVNSYHETVLDQRIAEIFSA